MKLDRPTLLKYAWRGGLIAVLSIGILAFGYRHGRAWLGSGAALTAGPPRVQGVAPLAPLPGSTLLRSHDCVFNGERTTFAQYRSPNPARQVIEQFEERYGTPTDQAPPGRGTMMRVAARGYAAAGAVDADGYTVGIVAFEDPKTSGCTYFVGRGKPASAPAPSPGGDVPGEEVPGVPRPPRARRVFCIDGLGGIASRLLVYEGWGTLEEAAAVFAAELPKGGWTRNSDAENVLQKHLEGKFLSFIKGTRRTMVYIERDPGTGKVRTAVAYTVKDWLPPDRGL